MRLARHPALKPARDQLGRRLHALIDSRIAERLAAEREGIVQEAFERGRRAALREHQQFGPPDRLHLAPGAQVNDALFNTVSGSITVAEDAFFGHGVAVLTGTHDISVTGPNRRWAIPAQGRDVEIGRGAWVSSRALVLGPCRIGEDAVVAAGAVVTGDVPAGAVVAGVPAKVVGRLPARAAGGIPPAVDAETDAGRLFLLAGDGALPAPEHVAELRGALRPGMTVLDVGAGDGYATVVAAQAVGEAGRVIAVEPDRARARLLRANAARRGLGNVEVVVPGDWEALDRALPGDARPDVVRVDARAAGHGTREGLGERFAGAVFVAAER